MTKQEKVTREFDVDIEKAIDSLESLRAQNAEIHTFRARDPKAFAEFEAEARAQQWSEKLERLREAEINTAAAQAFAGEKQISGDAFRNSAVIAAQLMSQPIVNEIVVGSAERVGRAIAIQHKVEEILRSELGEKTLVLLYPDPSKELFKYCFFTLDLLLHKIMHKTKEPVPDRDKAPRERLRELTQNAAAIHVVGFPKNSSSALQDKIIEAGTIVIALCEVSNIKKEEPLLARKKADLQEKLKEAIKDLPVEAKHRIFIELEQKTESRWSRLFANERLALTKLFVEIKI